MMVNVNPVTGENNLTLPSKIFLKVCDTYLKGRHGVNDAQC